MLNKYNFYVQDIENIGKDEYKRRTENYHIFHSLEWMNIIKETFGIKHKIAILEEDGIVVASIPFVNYHNMIKGLSALPLHFSGYYGSIISNNDLVKKKILNLFFEYCKKNKLFTQVPEVNKIKDVPSFLGYSIYKMRLKSNLSVEEQIFKFANKRNRSYTKSAINSNLVCSIGSLELLDKFYLLYLQNMKELGTPPLSKKYFKKIIEKLPQTAKILLVKNDKKVCCGMLILKVLKTELFVPIISTPRLYQEGQSSHLIYLQAAREAQNLGCSVINFGRSIDGSGPALFKKRFGLEATPLLMYSPNENWTVTDPNKSFLRYFVAIWKKLPIPLTKLGGLLFAKHIL